MTWLAKMDYKKGVNSPKIFNNNKLIKNLSIFNG